VPLHRSFVFSKKFFVQIFLSNSAIWSSSAPQFKYFFVHINCLTFSQNVVYVAEQNPAHVCYFFTCWSSSSKFIDRHLLLYKSKIFILITKNCLLFLADPFHFATALKRANKDVHRKPLVLVEFVQLGRIRHHADNRSVQLAKTPQNCRNTIYRFRVLANKRNECHCPSCRQDS